MICDDYQIYLTGLEARQHTLAALSCEFYILANRG